MNEVRWNEEQKKILKKMKNKNKFALFLGTGYGKTLLGLEFIEQRGGKTLIVCPKSVLDKENWQKERSKFGYSSEFDVINFESLHKIDVKRYETLIIDESHRAKTPKSKTFKQLSANNAKNILLLTATPIDKSNEEYYTSLYFLGLLSDLEIKKPNVFKERYTIHELTNSFGRHFLEFKDNKNTDELIQRFEKNAVFEKTPEVTKTELHYIKYKKHKDYNLMLKERCFFDEKEDEFILLDNVSKKVTFARIGLCGKYQGFDIPTQKNDNFAELLSMINDSVVVFYNFVNELEKIKEKASDYEVVEINGTKKEFDKLNKENKQLIAIQLQSGSTGIDGLQFLTNNVVYYSPPFSSTLFEQSKGRVDRKGQTKKVNFYCLCAVNSIETQIYEQLENKQNFKNSFFKD